MIGRTGMVCGCIDIGSNTTRVLVADVSEGRVRELVQERCFTHIGAELRADGRIGAAKIAEVADIVSRQRDLAEAAGCERLRVVATAAIRGAANGAELCEGVRARAGVEVVVLDGVQEARMAFLGATRTLTDPLTATEAVAVVDVGGGSSEVAIGTIQGGVRWARSLAIGSGALADAHVHADPPARQDLAAIRSAAAAAFAELDAPPADFAVAVGGSATSLRRLAGPLLDHAAIERSVAELCSAPAVEVAERHGLDARRVRLMPAGLLVLAEASRALGLPLCLGNGGLREGVVLELAGAA